MGSEGEREGKRGEPLEREAALARRRASDVEGPASENESEGRPAAKEALAQHEVTRLLRQRSAPLSATSARALAPRLDGRMRAI